MSALGPIARLTFAAALASSVSAAALAAPIISASIVANPTLTNLPFAVENFGTSATAGQVAGATSPITLSTGAIASFTGNSGVYSGDVSGVTRSPFRTAGGGATNLNYLNARANSGSIVLSYVNLGPQTAFNLLWGSVDPTPASYNQLTFTFSSASGSETVTGAQVATAAGSGVIAGTTNLAVSITGLNAFDTITITATQEAFEFAPGVPVPEPGTLALLGAGLLGLGFMRRRRAGAETKA